MNATTLETVVAPKRTDVHVRVVTKSGKNNIEHHPLSEGESFRGLYRAPENAKPYVEFTVASKKYNLKPGQERKASGITFGVEQRNSTHISVYARRE